MNKYTHFMTSFLLLFFLFRGKASVLSMLIFSYLFSIILDKNQIIGRRMGKPQHHTRTWIEEPFGVVLIGIPLAYLLSFINPYYFYMVLLSYSLHIFEDYLMLHEVSPLAPFSNWSIKVGIFKAYPPAVWYTGKEKGIDERIIMIPTALVFFGVLVWLVVGWL